MISPAARADVINPRDRIAIERLLDVAYPPSEILVCCHCRCEMDRAYGKPVKKTKTVLSICRWCHMIFRVRVWIEAW